ncbi:hypothetical protein C8Q75DRAFT_803318 [Abortiporus biennis]|nr:hypothetical protein C8Q75DRAFT_803318 [Abortiporus biennis]
MTEHLGCSLSQLSLHSTSSQVEDWDRSMQDDSDSPAVDRNSVTFPSNGLQSEEAGSPLAVGGKSKRTLSDLLKLHAEKGTDVTFTPEEASRVAEVLNQWINSSSSPYEGEDDFFARSHSQDDNAMSAKRSPSGAFDASGRPRGQSESVIKSAS